MSPDGNVNDMFGHGNMNPNPPPPSLVPPSPPRPPGAPMNDTQEMRQLMALAMNRAMIAERLAQVAQRRMTYMGMIVLPFVLVGGIVMGKFFL